MSTHKQKLSEMVLKKMKQKKQAQEKSRPHYQLLRLDIKFSIEQYNLIKQQTHLYNTKLNTQANQLQQLKQHLQQLENTGKQKNPTIILKPDFIASENISIQMKDFYRKTSNTFLKADLIKTQKHKVYTNKQKQIEAKINQIQQQQARQTQLNQKNNKILQKKRTRNLKEDLLRRKYIHQQQQLQTQIQSLKQINAPLLSEYQLKKENYQTRSNYCQHLHQKIQQEKIKIQEKFNPITYRNYLKKIFDVRIKNQYMEKNLNQVIMNINVIKKKQEQYQTQLENKCKSITFYGKVGNSPSKIKGKLQRNMIKQELRRSQTNPKNITEFMLSSEDKRQMSSAKSQRKIIHRKKSHRNNHQEDNFLKSISKKSKTGDHFTSLRTLKNSVKSQRTMSTTVKTIWTSTKKSKHLQ